LPNNTKEGTEMDTATSDLVAIRHGVRWTGDPEGVRHLLGVIDAEPDELVISDAVWDRLEGFVVSLDAADEWSVAWFMGDTDLGYTRLTARGWEAESGEPTSLSEVGADMSDAAVGVAAEAILARYCLAGDPTGLCRLVDDLGCRLSDLI
jgi:hypothetical protein